MLPTCLKTGSVGGLLWRGLHLFLTLKLHGPRGFLYITYFLNGANLFQDTILFHLVFAAMRGSQVCADGSVGRGGW